MITGKCNINVKPHLVYNIDEFQLEKWRENVPSELQKLRRWVLWRWDFSEHEGRWKKVPIRTCDRRYARFTDPEQLSYFQDCLDTIRYHQCHGINYVLGTDERLTSLDLDNCRDLETGQLAAWAWAIIERLNSYAELSPSGTGIRIFIKGALPAGGRVKEVEGGKIECYDARKTVSVTGHTLTGYATIKEGQTELEEWHKETFPQAPLKAVQAHSERVSFDDETIINKLSKAANRAKFESLFAGSTASYKSESDADFALIKLFRFYTQDATQLERLMYKSGLCRAKWETRRGDGTYLSESINNALKDGFTPYNPHFRSNSWQKKKGTERANLTSRSWGQPKACLKPKKLVKVKPANVKQALSMKPEQREILTRMQAHSGWLSLRAIRELAPGIPVSTLQRWLRDWVISGRLDRDGDRNQTGYRVPTQGTLADAGLDIK